MTKHSIVSILRKYWQVILLAILTLIAAFFRFYNLSWGPYYFHPDEHNIVYGISQLHFPQTMHPDFFVYGSFPAYVMYFIGVLIEWIKQGYTDWHIDPFQSIIIGRTLSALVGTLIIPLEYFIIKKLTNKDLLVLFGASLAVGMSGFIQYSHFTTFEIFLAFFYLTISYLSISLIQKPTTKKYIALGILLGLAIGTKVINAYLLPVPFLVSALSYVKDTKSGASESNLFSLAYVDFRKILFNKLPLMSLVTAGIVFLITNPYTVLDAPAFVDSLSFESNVATGVRSVFYTREFIKTTPVVYQLIHVLPFISGYLFTAIASITLLLLFLQKAKSRTKDDLIWLPLLYVYGAYLVLNLTLFVKWTRYMVPVLPILIISLIYTWENLHIKALLKNVLLICLFLEISIRGISFFTLYLHQDTRLQAADWVQSNIPANQSILIESNEPNSIVFSVIHPNNINEFDFYDVTEDSSEQLKNILTQTDYIILSSQRVYKDTLRLPEQNPAAYIYYQQLFNGELGFEEVAQFQTRPCIIPTSWQGKLPQSFIYTVCPINTEDAEGTFTVFDHPTVLVFKKSL